MPVKIIGGQALSRVVFNNFRAGKFLAQFVGEKLTIFGRIVNKESF
ncbi:MAG: hypothetical protein U5P41_16085 [Gammaproteobacteria bacterium]|nr:hypothetical protein [Gammaproteobacteria bacterium]